MNLEIIGALVAAIVIFAAGFMTEHTRATAAAETVAAAQAARDKAMLTSQLTLQRQLDDKAAETTATVATIDTTQHGLLSDDQADLARLRDCVARGTCGVRVIGAYCPATIAKVPGATPGAGVDSGAQPELDADARSTYFALRSGIATKERQLEACQQVLEAERK